MHYQVSPLSYTRVLKLFALNLVVTYFLNFFIVNKTLRLTPFLLVKVSVVIFAGGSLCCNYATDLCIYSNYTNDNICCIFAGFQVLLSVTGMLVGLSVCRCDCFCCNYAVRNFCSTYAGGSFCSKYVGDNFYCNYADGSLCSNYAGGIFCSALST